MRNYILTLMAMLVFVVVQAAGQGAKGTWNPPRTPDGQPDIQGVWTNNTVTPLQRPKELGAKEFYTEGELADIQRQQRNRLHEDYDEGKGQTPTNHTGIAGNPPDDVHYDFAQFGLDRLQSTVAWSRRTSLMVGPEGTIPPLTAEARKFLAERAAKEKGHEFDSVEHRPLESRCIVRAAVGPPLLPTGYNSNLQIFQGKGYVAIEAEEIHDVRIIPLDGRPHLPKNIRQWYGDSVGHWEGNTLVIDTTNFTDKIPFPGAQNLHVVERITPTDNDSLLYQFTVEDSGYWTKPWSGEVLIKKMKGQIYEYACHEANYPLENTLRGARVAEAEAASKGEKR
jgi:hypothetical protein